MQALQKIVVLLIISSFFPNVCFGQKQQESLKVFKQKQLDAYKVHEYVYSFRDRMDSWIIYKKEDSLGYFVDERTYKGVINYGVEFYHVDKTNVTYTENKQVYYLDVLIDNVVFNKSDSTVKIKGSIKGGWSIDHSSGWKNRNNSVSVYLGNKKDTLKNIHFEPKKITSFPENYIIKYKGEKLKNTQVIDSFPAFYMSNYTKYKTNKGATRTFEIEAKIDKNSILVFGLDYCYAEIFEIGKLVFDNKEEGKKRRKEYKNTKKKKREEEFQVIIRNNVQQLYKDTITKPELNWYYKTINVAENYMMQKQYGKAREEYGKLLEKDHYVFARDLHNALRIAILSRAYKTAIIYCEKLVLKGVPLSYFDAKIFKKLKSSGYWAGFLTHYPELYKTYEKGLNHSLIKQLADLVALDQKDYTRQAKGEFDRSKLKATTEKVDGKLIQLIKEEGFPTEEKIGVKIYQDTLISTSNDYYVLINHSHQTYSKRLPEIKEILRNSAQNFEYDNVRNNLNILININPCLMLYKGNLYNSKSCGLVNKKELKKIDFSFNNPHGFIANQGAMGILGYNKKNEAEDDTFFKERYNFIKKLTDDWYED